MELPAATKPTDANFVRVIRKKIQWTKVVTNDSIGTCSSELYLFHLSKLVRLHATTTCWALCTWKWTSMPNSTPMTSTCLTIWVFPLRSHYIFFAEFEDFCMRYSCEGFLSTSVVMMQPFLLTLRRTVINRLSTGLELSLQSAYRASKLQKRATTVTDHHTTFSSDLHFDAKDRERESGPETEKNMLQR